MDDVRSLTDGVIKEVFKMGSETGLKIKKDDKIYVVFLSDDAIAYVDD